MGAGDYPAGAYNDPRAPYNEELTKERDYFISTSVSFTLKGISEKDAKEKSEGIIQLMSRFKPIDNFNIDELEVIEE